MLKISSSERRPERKTKGWVLLVLAAALLASARVDAQTWEWKTETVDSEGRFTSLAVDDQGNLHISYASGQRVKYGFRPAGSSRWFTMEVDKGDHATRLTLDREGNPHLCYSSYGTLKYAHWDGQNWLIQPIAEGSGTISFSCSVGLAADGTPHVTWYQVGRPDGSNYLHVRYAILRDGAWRSRTLDFDGQTGKWNSMVLDAQGLPHVSYDSFIKGELKYAYWGGTHWNIRVVDSRNLSRQEYNIGMGNSVILGADGKARISYYTENALKYARQEEARWVIEKVDSMSPLGSWVGFWSGLVLDQGGYAHISYEDGGALKHAYWDGQKWQIQLLVGAGNESYRYGSMAIDREDTLYISYRDALDGSVKVAVARRASRPRASIAGSPEKK